MAEPRRTLDVPIAALPAGRMKPELDARGAARLDEGLRSLSDALGERVLWNVNSTAAGGGVAEMLRSLLPYLRGAGIDTRWQVIQADEPFFELTKRIHNLIHGEIVFGPIDESDRAGYEAALAENAFSLRETVRAGDVVILHDPQVAGLAPAMKAAGATVLWRSHVGTERRNGSTATAWEFLLPYLEAADGYIFSRRQYVPAALAKKDVWVIQPSIDPASTKNQSMSSETAHAILDQAGLGRHEPFDRRRAVFTRQDGSPGRVEHGAEVLRTGAAPRLGSVPLVVQVSRWDQLKDPAGVLRGFADHVLSHSPAQLLLAGPTVHSVADDPDAAECLDEVISIWWTLPHTARKKIQLACLPMRDLDENAAIVNALQLSAAVVVQKSLEEGFGLTVAEAMWKHRAVVACGVGGIQDQIEDQKSGILLGDPLDLEAFGEQVSGLLLDPQRAAMLGEQAHLRVHEHFLHDRQIADHAALLCDLLRR